MSRLAGLVLCLWLGGCPGFVSGLQVVAGGLTIAKDAFGLDTAIVRNRQVRDAAAQK